MFRQTQLRGDLCAMQGLIISILNEVDTWQIHGRYVVDRYPSLFGGNQDG